MCMPNLVDLHCHILPGVDDGSPDLEHSLQLAYQAVADGVTHILATPHHLDKNYVNHHKAVIEKTAEFQAALCERKIPLKVFPGQEIHINGNLLSNYDDFLGTDIKKNYILLELPHGDVPAYTDRIIFELRKRGTTPVIVHPERNLKIQSDQNILYNLVQKGALAQLTATSYIGGFGEHVANISRSLISHGLIHVVASDAHVLPGRNFVLRESINEIAKEFGRQQSQFFKHNAECLLNGIEIVQQPYSPIIKRKKRFYIF